MRPEFCQQDASDGMRSPWISCSRGVEEVSGGGQSAQKIKNTVQPVFREEPNLRLEFYLRDVTVAVTLETSCSRGVEVSKSFLEVVKVARKRVNVVQRVIRLGFDSAMKDADRDAWWPAFLNEVSQPEAHAPIVWCLSAMSSLRRSFRHLEAQSTFTSGMSGRLSVEMSLMRKSAERETVQDVMEKRCYFAFFYDTKLTSTA